MAKSTAGDTAANMPVRTQTLRRGLVIALLALTLLPSMYMAWISRRMPILGAFHDASIYWVTGKSIAEGHGYRIASLPEQPWQTKYPPLFPMCLSLIWRIAPDFPQNLPWATLF